jgi:transcriptional regulator with XRE-family HTH domain
MPYIKALKLTAFAEVVEEPMIVGRVQGMFIKSSDLYRGEKYLTDRDGNRHREPMPTNQPVAGEAMRIGTLIRSHRMEHGLSQKNLAPVLGISAPMLSLVENGKKRPSLRVVLRAAVRLKCPSLIDEHFLCAWRNDPTLAHLSPAGYRSLRRLGQLGEALAFFHVDGVRRICNLNRPAETVVTVSIEGTPTDVSIYNRGVSLYWFDDRTDKDVRRMLSDLEAREGA